ncbi:Polyprenyl synthetase [Sesbania bispinosa]|nr:Polyprenyl synthetase [Sesbania bispinosa]
MRKPISATSVRNATKHRATTKLHAQTPTTARLPLSGKETVHQLFGTRVAVLAGDFMFAQSSWYLANLENIEVIKLISQIFQVVDDILDFTQSAEQLGKPADTDLAKGNLTAPVIFALEKEPKLRDIIESEFSETGSLDEAINLVKSCGGIERARELAKEKADLAIQSLTSFKTIF